MSENTVTGYELLPDFRKLVESEASKMAEALHGGMWNKDYTETQKIGWRQRAAWALKRYDGLCTLGDVEMYYGDGTDGLFGLHRQQPESDVACNHLFKELAGSNTKTCIHCGVARLIGAVQLEKDKVVKYYLYEYGSFLVGDIEVNHAGLLDDDPLYEIINAADTDATLTFHHGDDRYQGVSVRTEKL